MVGVGGGGAGKQFQMARSIGQRRPARCPGSGPARCPGSGTGAAAGARRTHRSCCRGSRSGGWRARRTARRAARTCPGARACVCVCVEAVGGARGGGAALSLAGVAADWPRWPSSHEGLRRHGLVEGGVEDGHFGWGGVGVGGAWPGSGEWRSPQVRLCILAAPLCPPPPPWLALGRVREGVERRVNALHVYVGGGGRKGGEFLSADSKCQSPVSCGLGFGAVDPPCPGAPPACRPPACRGSAPLLATGAHAPAGLAGCAGGPGRRRP